MVKIRLRRVGTKKKPSYRVVVAESRAPRDGAFIDVIGHYNPLTDPETIVIDKERALHWLRHGAQPTDTVARLLAKVGIIEESKARAEKIKAGTSQKSETNKEEPQATITEEPEPKQERTKTNEEKTKT